MNYQKELTNNKHITDFNMMVLIIIIMTPVPAGLCSQGHHSHNTSHGDWWHNPETADHSRSYNYKNYRNSKTIPFT